MRMREVYDLPRRADSKVAWHLLDRRVGPSSPEGHSGKASLKLHLPNFESSSPGNRTPGDPPVRFQISNF